MKSDLYRLQATGKEKTAHLRLTNSLLVRHLSFAKLSDLCPSTLHLGKLLDFVSANVNESVRLHLDLRKVQGSHFYFEIKQGHKVRDTKLIAFLLDFKH